MTKNNKCLTNSDYKYIFYLGLLIFVSFSMYVAFSIGVLTTRVDLIEQKITTQDNINNPYEEDNINNPYEENSINSSFYTNTSSPFIIGVNFIGSSVQMNIYSTNNYDLSKLDDVGGLGFDLKLPKNEFRNTTINFQYPEDLIEIDCPEFLDYDKCYILKDEVLK